MHIAKGGGHGEAASLHLGQFLINLCDLLRLGIQVLGIGILIVHAILLTACDAQLHLQQDVDLSHTLQVLLADLNVLLKRLLREINHVRGEERFAMQLKVALVCLHQPIQPRKQVLGAVVGVQDDRNTVLLSKGADMVCARDGARDASMEVAVVQPLASIELGSSGGELDDNWRVHLPGGLHASIDTGGRHAVHGRNGVLVLLSVHQQVHASLASDNSGVDSVRQLGEGPLNFLTLALCEDREALLRSKCCLSRLSVHSTAGLAR
mmetsp:Transcript_26817/g.49284  ORF Transcript_26817/g.49284 Transcript_26817/m.49284 type:complete len:265 (-) Transcript_26817:277-1071(-)